MSRRTHIQLGSGQQVYKTQLATLTASHIENVTRNFLSA